MTKSSTDMVSSVERTKNRPKRVPLGHRSRLSFVGIRIPKDMVPRVINDQGTRIQEALEAGYRFVLSDGKLGEIRCADPSKIGSYVTKSVGGGTMGFLMAIPKDFYDEDQAAKQAKVNETEKGMRTPPQTLEFEGKKGDGVTYGPGLTDD